MDVKVNSISVCSKYDKLHTNIYITYHFCTQTIFLSDLPFSEIANSSRESERKSEREREREGVNRQRQRDREMGEYIFINLIDFNKFHAPAFTSITSNQVFQYSLKR